MSVQENKAVVRRWIAARITNDVEAAVAQWGPDWQDRLPRAFNHYTEGFSGIQITVEEMVAEGDKVATWWTFRGIHRGVFAGVPATGKTIEWSGADLYTVVNGKIVACTRRGRSLKDLLLKSSER